MYLAATNKLEKTQLIASIVEKVRRDSPGGGFVQKDFATGLWHEIGDDKARDKVGHAIRRVIDDAKKKSRKSIKAKSTLTDAAGTDSTSVEKGSTFRHTKAMDKHVFDHDDVVTESTFKGKMFVDSIEEFVYPDTGNHTTISVGKISDQDGGGLALLPDRFFSQAQHNKNPNNIVMPSSLFHQGRSFGSASTFDNSQVIATMNQSLTGQPCSGMVFPQMTSSFINEPAQDSLPGVVERSSASSQHQVDRLDQTRTADNGYLPLPMHLNQAETQAERFSTLMREQQHHMNLLLRNRLTLSDHSQSGIQSFTGYVCETEDGILLQKISQMAGRTHSASSECATGGHMGSSGVMWSTTGSLGREASMSHQLGEGAFDSLPLLP